MEKQEILKKFLEMIKKSWTFQEMTEFEKQKLFDTFSNIQISNVLKYTEKHCWEILQCIYTSFLAGLGYTDFNWRSENENNPKF